MLTIYYGDDTTRSRNDFLKLREKLHIEKTFQGREITITELMQVFDGGSFFEESQTVVIENFLSSRKEGKETAALRDYLKEKSATHTIYLWEGKDLTKTQLAKLGNAVPKQYKLPQSLFQFLESIKPGNGIPAIKLFHMTLSANESEMIFFMLVRHIRILLALIYNDPIEETKRIDWQRGKLLSQAKSFPVDRLKSLYQSFSEIDVKSKTGTLGVPLDTAIDMLLLEL